MSNARSPNLADLAELLPPLRAIIDLIEGSVERSEEWDASRREYDGRLLPETVDFRRNYEAIRTVLCRVPIVVREECPACGNCRQNADLFHDRDGTNRECRFCHHRWRHDTPIVEAP